MLSVVSPGVSGCLDKGSGGGGEGVQRRAEQELDAAQEVRLPLGLRCWGFLACCGFLPVGVSA